MIPKIIHFIFGLDATFCNKPLELFHLLNIKSVIATNCGFEYVFHYYYEPSGDIWDQIKSLCIINRIDNLPNKRKFAYTEHISDLFRVEILKLEGGVYLDIDVICIKPLQSLFNNFVIGEEYGEGNKIGLCNAVLISEKDSIFSDLWIRGIYEYYSKEWNYYAVQLPYNLSINNTQHLHIESATSFFKYSWDKQGRDDLFYNNSDIKECYCLHLWEHKNYDILKTHTRDVILNSNTTVTNLYKKYI